VKQLTLMVSLLVSLVKEESSNVIANVIARHLHNASRICFTCGGWQHHGQNT